MVKQGFIDIFRKNSKPTKKTYDTNKAVVKQVDKNLDLQLLDIASYGTRFITGDNFFQLWLTILATREYQ